MDNELMDFNYQIQSESITEETTRQKMSVWFSIYPPLIDALFEVAYFIGTTENATSPEGHFHHLGRQILVQFPYTVRATCILIEKGFYFEAISLIRNLFESFIQLRYFHKHEDTIKSFVTGKKKVPFKIMFEEVAPGFYDKVYGKQLSIFAHSRLASGIFRTEYFSPNDSKTRLGSEYDEMGFGYAVNKLWVIIFGVLNFIPVLFPEYPNRVTEITEAKRTSSLIWLELLMKIQKEVSPESKNFYSLVDPLIRIP